jgi:hypothetical protein
LVAGCIAAAVPIGQGRDRPWLGRRGGLQSLGGRSREA